MNWIVLIEESDNCQLNISLKWGDVFQNQITNFMPLRHTAFAVHPHRPPGGFSFESYETAFLYKGRWEFFLETYLDKNRRNW